MNILKYLNKSENSVSILFAISILSMSFPYGFPLFGVLTLVFVLLKIFSGRFKISINLGFIIYFVTIFIYIFGVFLNKGVIYSHNKSDILNIISFIFIWILLSDLKKIEYNTLFKKMIKYSVWVCFVISIISIYKFLMLTKNVNIDKFYTGNYYPGGTSLVVDYNMFSFALLTGLIFNISILREKLTISTRFFYTISLLLIFLSIAFAGSRRGWVLLGVIFVCLIMKFTINSLDVHKFFKQTIKASPIFLIIIVLFIFFSNSNNLFIASNEIDKLQYRFQTLKINEVDDSLSSRTKRWQYAYEMYNDYDFLQLTFGKGFSYLPKYGKRFNTDLEEDYPHSPFLSVLLYGGIIGVFSLVLLFLWTIYLTIKNRKNLNIYLIALFYLSIPIIIVSSNSIFSISLFNLIILIIFSNNKRITRYKELEGY